MTHSDQPDPVRLPDAEPDADPDPGPFSLPQVDVGYPYVSTSRRRRSQGAAGLSRLARRRSQRWWGVLVLAAATVYLVVSLGLDGRFTATAAPVSGRSAPDGGDPAAAPVPPAVAPPAVAPPAAAPPAVVPVAAAPPAPVSPTPPGSSRWQPLAAAIGADMRDFPGRYGVVVVDLVDGSRWEYQADAEFHPASLIKMPVSLYALDQVMAGQARWSDGVTYLAQDYESPGGGALETDPLGGIYSVENLVGRALRYSNNIAVNMLGRHFGWDNVRAFTHRIHGDLLAGPLVTPGSVAGWWLHLHELSHRQPQQAEALLQPLREVAYTGRIGAGVPAGVPLLHKFGSYDGNFHDSALVQGKHPFVLVVLTGGATEEQGDQAIARVARTIWSFMQER